MSDNIILKLSSENATTDKNTNDTDSNPCNFECILKKQINNVEGVKLINHLKDGKDTLVKKDLNILRTTMNAFVFDVLGFLNDTKDQSSGKIDGGVSLLIKLRKEARDNKDWDLSDQIRDELLAIGIQLKDGREGTTYSIN